MAYFSKAVLLCSGLLLALALNSQVLVNQNLGLNPGGVIYDVVEDPYHDCYIIAGNFSTVNGVGCNNIAFINRADFTVNEDTILNTITAIDGEIRTIELYHHETFTYHYYRLYLGGNFTTLQAGGPALNRNGFVELVSQKSKFLPPAETPFTPTSWDIQIEYAGEERGVNDLLLQNDTLIIAGGFFFNNGALPYANLANVISFNASTHAWIPLFNNMNLETEGYNYYLGHVLSIEKWGDAYYLSGSEEYSNAGGTGFLVRCDANGLYDPAFTAPLCGTMDAVWQSIPAVSGVDSMIISVSKYAAATGSYAHDLNGNLVDGPFCAMVDVLNNCEGIAGYKDQLITRVTGSLSFLELNGTYPAPVATTIPTNAVSYTTSTGGLAASFSPGGLGYRRMHVSENYLFVSGNSLTTIGGMPRTGLAIYCLEPMDAKFFTASDSTVCPDQLVTYTVPPVEYAEGYLWEYTGNGAEFSYNTNTYFSPVSFMDTAAHSIDVLYKSTFTPGQLKVTPFVICNASDTLYSNTIVTNIVSNPLPHIDAGPDTTLTCAADTILLHGVSDSAVISYEWLHPSLQNVQGQDTLAVQPGNYVFKVTNPIGCPNYDTVYVSIDTVPPIAIPPTGTYDLTCAEPQKNFTGTTPTPNTTTQWYDPASSTFFANPIPVGLPGSYDFIVTDTINGCSTTIAILVELNTPQPNITVLGYPGYNPALPLDTITCYTPVLNLTCSSDTANTTATWTDEDTVAVLGNNLNITTGGNYYILVTNNDNGCTNFTGIHISEFDNIPNAVAPADAFLNCSVDSVLLDGHSLLAGAQLNWDGSGIPASTNPVTIYDPGTYYLTATDPANGCIATDSVIILQDNSILVSAGDDLLACNKDTITLTANYAGTIGGISYLWNSGSTDPSAQYISGESGFGVVEIFGDNGCYGTDTVFLDLPPAPVVLLEGFRSCDNGPSGQIVATPVSGLAPFDYSIDNGSTYQTNPVFANLYTGSYDILVRDSLACEYPFTATIDASSALPEALFLFSTYNYETDTVVLIDVSNPPADSTNWIFPPELFVLDNTPLSPVVLLPDTGSFQITLQAFFGDCMVELSKTIYSSLFDSLAATGYNSNGIASVTLYPNPTNGPFTTTISFFKSQRAVMVIQDLTGNTYFYKAYDETLNISETISLDSSLPDGTYVMKIVSEFDSAYITFILAH